MLGVEPQPFTDAQRTVLYAIRRRGEATAEQLAEALDMTLSGARQHLVALGQAGLVVTAAAAREPGKRGPATKVHRLTERAESLFPKAYGELTNQILGYLEPEAVSTVFIRRRDDRIDAGRARVGRHRAFADRVREVATILDEDGYLASFEQEGPDRFRVTEHNCAILSVAREHPHACSSEIEFIRAMLPEATVERTMHMMAGDHSCSYEIRHAGPTAA